MVNHFHPQTISFKSDDIQLSDVQLALARELGLSSWPQLKAHTANLDRHLRAIQNNDEILDCNLETLHVRCGNDIQKRLKTCGFNGEFLALIDPLCMGPIPANEKHFIDVRSRYVLENLLSVIGKDNTTTTTALEVASAEEKKIDTLLSEKFQRIVFWVEHDSYDQLMLLRALTLLAQPGDRLIEVIELNDFPGGQRFTGIGQLPIEAIRSCWKMRRTVEPRIFGQAKIVWDALTSGVPDSLLNLIKHYDADCFPNLLNVFIRVLQELPDSKTGLSLTQHIAFLILNEQGERMSFSSLFQEYQQREPLPFLGDAMFYALLLPLIKGDVPLITIHCSDKAWQEQHFTLSSAGKDCLNGNFRIYQNYWVAGIHNNKECQWSWDHQNLDSFKKDVPENC